MDRAGSYLYTEKFLEQHTHRVQEAEHGSHLPYLGEEGAAIYRGELTSGWLIRVTRETSRWGRGQACRQLQIKPYH